MSTTVGLAARSWAHSRARRRPRIRTASVRARVDTRNSRKTCDYGLPANLLVLRGVGVLCLRAAGYEPPAEQAPQDDGPVAQHPRRNCRPDCHRHRDDLSSKLPASSLDPSTATARRPRLLPTDNSWPSDNPRPSWTRWTRSEPPSLNRSRRPRRSTLSTPRRATDPLSPWIASAS